MDRSWMYDRLYSRRSGLKPKFITGVQEFITAAIQHDMAYEKKMGIRCPCVLCHLEAVKSPGDVICDLYAKGFMPNYLVWTSHGEIDPNANFKPTSMLNPTTSAQPDTMAEYYQQYEAMQGMICDGLGVNLSYEEQQGDEPDEQPNEEAQRFYSLLHETNKPLFHGSSESRLSICVRLLGIRTSYNNVAEQCIEAMVKLMLDASPIRTSLPSSYYEAKSLVSKLGLGAMRIDCCVNGCMLFYDNEFGINDGALTQCKICQEPRYKPRRSGTTTNKPVPRKAMFYLSIVARLQRMFASMHTAPHMSWHHENRNTSGKLRHPSDGEAWKHFDRVHPNFAKESRNVRLGLCSDGFTPYVQASTRAYSCWPVVVTPYNLPPEMCMTKPYMFLAAVLPGPDSPKSGIDIYLQPLIDDLKRLWAGVSTYDISRKKNFKLRAALMWTINDFPAYSMLSGWGTHGKYACPICMEDTKAFNLKYGGKTSWFDSHRRFLPAKDSFRKNKKDFIKGRVEVGEPPHMHTPREVWEKVRDIPKVKVEKGKTTNPPGYGRLHNWKKQSIFWDLPYWKDNLLRHNLDVMHIEKNFFDNIFNTVMNVKGKTKDNDKARKDMEIYCNRPEYHFRTLDNGKIFKPKGRYVLSPDEAKDVYRWISKLKMPDGYCSNLAKCADVENQKMTGMKSHDCHIFMECLLPIAFSKLEDCVLSPLVEISHYFKNLCSTTLALNDLIQMEKNIPKILCNLERVFPPGFFDSMEHLPLHLAYEARLGGPVQYRWMYPFERFMGDAKRSVNNKARVEGSIVASYIHRETINFCSHYFNDTAMSNRIRRNEVIGDERHPLALSIFQLPGQTAGMEGEHWFSQEELHSAHIHLLINCKEVQPYLQLFLTSAGYSNNDINSNFPGWFREYVYNQQPTPLMQHLQNLSDGPNKTVKKWHTYKVNGYKFQTQEQTEHKETMNSGVYIKGDTGGAESDFYGVIQHIYELEYISLDYSKTVVLFYCNWFDPSSLGTKINRRTKTVDVKMNRRYPHFDPFVMAHNVRQVYYVQYPSPLADKRGWCVAILTKPRGRLETEELQEQPPYQMEETSNVNDGIVVEQIMQLGDCVGEELDTDSGDHTEEDEQDFDNHAANESEDDFDEEWP